MVMLNVVSVGPAVVLVLKKLDLLQCQCQLTAFRECSNVFDRVMSMIVGMGSLKVQISKFQCQKI